MIPVITEWLVGVFVIGERVAPRIARGLLIAYLAWVGLTMLIALALALSVGIGWLLATILWITFGLLGPFLLFAPTREIVLGVLATAVLALLLGIRAGWAYAPYIAAAMTGLITSPYLPLSKEWKPRAQKVFAGALVSILAVSAVQQAIPHSFDLIRQIAHQSTGAPAFDPRTGQERVRLNLRTCQEFPVDFRFDPETREDLAVPTGEQVRRCRERRRAAAATPAVAWDHEELYTTSGTKITRYQVPAKAGWVFFSTKKAYFVSSEPNGTKQEFEIPANQISGNCSRQTWQNLSPYAGALELRVEEPDTVVRVKICK